MAKAKNGNKKVALGLGVAATAAAAAAGAYWLYGSKNAAKHRRQVRGWMLKARGEVMDAVEKLKDVDKGTYLKIVEEVGKRYTGAAGVTKAEVSALVKELKDSWNQIHKSARPGKTKKK